VILLVCEYIDSVNMDKPFEKGGIESE